MREDLHGDVNGHRVRMEWRPEDSYEGIRRATLDDVPAWIERARAKYPERAVELSRAWVEWCVTDPDHLVLVGQSAAGIAEIMRRYGFETRARLAVLFGEPSWESLRMVRLMVQWAKAKGASPPFRMDADTGVDFEPFSRRLGGRTVTINRYEIPF